MSFNLYHDYPKKNSHRTLALEAYYAFHFGRELADVWLKHRSNVERVARAHGRSVPTPDDPSKSITTWSLRRLGALPGPQVHYNGMRGLRKEIVVLVALDRWDAECSPIEGITLQVGEDISSGGSEPIYLSGQGGCRILFFALELPAVATSED
ncbi:hypothetical protein LTR56_022981 [Elasticomyces elasticus]|nr:hypothetical protein LTR56_022981 [Elasticomyces elasticus]KAK4907399.1 hypothetical protein LTR49_023582 [Elasticomyces elasticus]